VRLRAAFRVKRDVGVKAPIARMVVKAARGTGRRDKARQVKPPPQRPVPSARTQHPAQLQSIPA